MIHIAMEAITAKATIDVDFTLIRHVNTYDCGTPIYTIVLPPANSTIDLYYSKLSIFQHPAILEYSAVVYCNPEILFDMDIRALVSTDLNPKKLYVDTGNRLPTDYRHEWFRLDGFRFIDAQIAHLDSLGIRPFNGGLFMFKPTYVMEVYFKCIRTFKHRYADDEPAGHDLAFMNFYFAMLAHVDDKWLPSHGVALSCPIPSAGKSQPAAGAIVIASGGSIMRVCNDQLMEVPAAHVDNGAELLARMRALWQARRK
jgi:hypothetical protein